MSKRYVYIDFFRLICALMVIGIHTFPFESISADLDFALTHVIFRIAVPFFVMTSGFFLRDRFLESSFKPVGAFIKKIFVMYILCILLYLPLNLYMMKTGQIEWFKEGSNVILELIKLLFFDSTMYHFWYFSGVAMGSVIVWLLLRLGMKSAFFLSAFLYMIGLFGDSYYGVGGILGIQGFYDFLSVISTYTRNGIFYIPIFLMLGIIARKDRVKSQTFALGMIFVLSIAILFEGFVLRAIGSIRHDSMYLLLPLLCFMVFSQVVNIEVKGGRAISQKLKHVNYDFNFMSLLIYIIHPYIIVGIRLAAKIIKLEKILIENSVIHFIAVSVISFIIAYLISTLIKTRGKNVRIRKIKSVD